MTNIKSEFEPHLPGHLIDRLLKDSTIIGECLIWNGAKTQAGYGVINLNYKTRSIHRLVGSYLFGDIKNFLICHKVECTSRACFRPTHLYKGDETTNINDAIEKGTHRAPLTEANSLKTYCPQGHYYSKENTYTTPTGTRQCKTCKYEGRRKSWNKLNK